MITVMIDAAIVDRVTSQKLLDLIHSVHVLFPKKESPKYLRHFILTCFSWDLLLVVAYIGRVKQDQSYLFKIGLILLDISNLLIIQLKNEQ